MTQDSESPPPESPGASQRSDSPAHEAPADKIRRLKMQRLAREGSPDPVQSPLTSARSNNVVRARRIANRYNLGPYTRELEEFAAEDSLDQNLRILARIIALDTRVSTLTGSSQKYVADKALMVSLRFGLRFRSF